MKKILISAVCVVLAACSSTAQQPKSLLGTDSAVPSFTAAYDNFSCDQLYSEARRITEQMHDIAGVRDEDVSMERLEFIGGVLYWPVLLLVDGSSDSAAAQQEYDQLKARLLSLTEWVAVKECGA